MITRHTLRIASRASRASRQTLPSQRPAIASFSSKAPLKSNPILDDPALNGGYQNPPPQKREERDPYGDWWDKQERRNFGEPVHEDNDLLGRFSLHDYTHMSPARAGVMWIGFISLVLGLLYTVKATYPDRPSAPKEYEGGLDVELGGPGSVRAQKAGDEV